MPNEAKNIKELRKDETGLSFGKKPRECVKEMKSEVLNEKSR